MVLVYAAVGQNQDVCAVAVCAVCGHKHAVNGALEWGVFIIQHGNRLNLKARLIHVFDLHQVDVGQNRVLNAQHAAIFCIFAEQVAVMAEIYGGIRDNFLADGVNRRVGNLCEQLLEVAEQRLMLLGQHGERNVDAHCGGRLCAGLCHLQNRILDFLVGVAERLVQAVALLAGIAADVMVRNRQILEHEQALIQPLAVRLTGCILLLQLVIVNQTTGNRIDQQHLARLQAGLDGNLFRLQLQHANLRGQNQLIIRGNVVAGRTQTVSVEHSAHDIAVGKDNGCRTVPRLHHGCVVAVEVQLLARHALIVRPRLRNADHNCHRKLHAVHDEELQRVVQTGGVGACRIDNRIDLVEILLAHDIGFHRLLAGEHAVRVAANRVDFAVVQDEAVRMCALPGRVGVGGETGMYHRNGGLVILIQQVAVEVAQLADQKHALIYNGAAGERNDIGVVVGLLKDAARHVQLAVKIQTLIYVLRAGNEALLDVRHTGECLVAQNVRIDGHGAPAEELHALFFDNNLEHLLCLRTLERILREEEHRDAVIALFANLDAGLRGSLGEEVVGNLQHDADAVTGLALGVLAGAVLQLFYNRQCIVHRLVRFSALDIDNCADAAGIMLIPRIV